MYYIYITFYSVHDAISFKSNFKNKFLFRLVPVPKEIDKSCGVAVKLTEKDYKDISIDIKKNNIKYKRIYKLLEY